MIPNKVEFKTQVLEKIVQYSEMYIKPEELNQLQFYTEDRFYGEVLLRVKREFFGERVIKEISHDFVHEKYTSFWQHFKADYFPKFLLKRFPAKTVKQIETKTTTLERDFYFPKVQGNQFSSYIVQDIIYPQYNLK